MSVETLLSEAGAAPVGPLAGLLVVDLSRALAGPHAAMMLGDLGARVIKLETPGTGDDTRGWGPPFVGPDDDRQATYFLSCNRNKESVAVDLKSDDGRMLLTALIERADVVVENFRTGVMERLGFSTHRLAELNPRLVLLSITGFGHDGPEGGRAGYDQIVQGEAGLMSLTGSSPTVVVFDGLLHFWLGDQARLLAPGDTVSIPAGTPFAYRFLSNYTRILFYSAGGASLGLVPRVGLPIDAHVHPARPEHPVTVDELRDVGAEFGISYPDLQKSEAALQHDEIRPAGVVPYFLSSGEGERTRTFNQLNTFLSRGENTGSDYFAMHTTGAKAGYIPLHFHQRHTENFLCLEGRIWLHVNGRELLLTKGDFVHAPAGTIHSFSLDSHHTQMVGFLAPSIFEKFFDYMNEPTTDAVYPEGGEFFFPGEGFARAQAELDLVVVGAPPTRSAALDV